MKAKRLIFALLALMIFNLSSCVVSEQKRQERYARRHNTDVREHNLDRNDRGDDARR